MDEELHAENLAYIQEPSVRRAYSLLRAETGRNGLRTSVGRNSNTRPMRMHGFVQGEYLYLFSCDRARRHLRLYLRKHALTRWPQLTAEARARFPDVRTNNGGETIIYIRSEAEARTLADWLLKPRKWDRPISTRALASI